MNSWYIPTMNYGNNGERLNHNHPNPHSTHELRSDHNHESAVDDNVQDSLRRCRSVEQNRLWRQSRQGTETVQEADARDGCKSQITCRDWSHCRTSAMIPITVQERA